MLEIKNRRECFFDNFLIDENLSNAEKRLHKPVRKRELLVLDKPWEGKENLFFCPIYADGKWKLYYASIHEDELATIAYLPYPSYLIINEKLEEDKLSYAEKVSRWASIGASEFSNDTFNIFVSHLFMVGAKTRDYEVKAGDLFAVPSNMIPNADYTALGHIHTPQ